MTVPFEGRTYNINLDRKSLNTYLGFKIEDLKVEDKSWVKSLTIHTCMIKQNVRHSLRNLLLYNNISLKTLPYPISLI